MFEAEWACLRCESRFPAGSRDWTCSRCGANLELRYDYARLGKVCTRESLANERERSMWRYRALLPIDDESFIPPLAVGATPLYPVPQLGSQWGLPKLYLKDDSRNPTGSLKDRASAVAVARARAEGRGILACASTGNAASSLAGLCASSGLRSVIFVPEATSSAKLAQILAYGAHLVRVEGTYDEAFDLAAEASRRFSWYSRNTGTNPYLTEGKKTAAFEIAEGLRWRAPDWLFVPVGDGCIIGSVGKGFEELKTLGWIDSLPRLVGVQSEGAGAIADAVVGGGEVRASSGRTRAEGIAVSLPRDADRALRAIRRSGGTAIKVPDEEILDAETELARATGVFVEPAAAAAFAGFLRFSRERRLAVDDAVVLLLTGSGLKAPDAVLDRARLPRPLPPRLDALESWLGQSATAELLP
jgi:threonine synthase